MAVTQQADLNLLKAAKSGDAAEVEVALRCAVDKNCRENRGYRFTAVHRAVYSNERVAGVLIRDLDVNLNLKSTLGHTPLHFGWSGCVAEMLASGRTDIDWDVPDNIGQTPLLYHARLVNEVIVRALLKLGESAVNMSNNKTIDGFTALHQVVEQDRRSFPSWYKFRSLDERCNLVGILLEAKKERARTRRELANLSQEARELESDVLEFVNTKDILKRSALHYIAEEGCVAILDKLLKWFTHQEIRDSVDVNDADVHGFAPLHLAVQRGHRDVVRQLLQLPERQIDPNVRATLRVSHPDELQEYEENHKHLCRPDLFSKAPTEQYSGKDLTPLHLAAMRGHTEIARLLLDRPNTEVFTDTTGRSPLDYSIVNRHFQVAAELLMNPKGRTMEPMSDNERWEMFDKVLCLAEGPDDKTTAKALLTKLVDSTNRSVPITDFGLDHSKLLITVAAMENRHKIIRHILKWEPEVNTNFKSEWDDNRGLEATPLHFAVLGEHVDAVRALLTHLPLDANVEDSSSRTPLQIATESNRNVMREIEKLLMERPEVKELVDRLYRDRQVFVDAANALLVGAALVASVAFASWLQPPRGYTSNESDVAVKGHPTLQAFVLFNGFSFFFAIATVLASAYAAMPSLQQAFIGTVVKSVRKTLIVASIFLSISVFCVLGAFATAGFAVLPPSIKYNWSMWVTAIIGGIVCVMWLVAFVWKLSAAFRLP